MLFIFNEEKRNMADFECFPRISVHIRDLDTLRDEDTIPPTMHLIAISSNYAYQLDGFIRHMRSWQSTIIFYLQNLLYCMDVQ